MSNLAVMYLCPSDTPSTQIPVQSVGHTLSEFERLDLDPSEFEGEANSYTCPIGAEPGSAMLLMTRKAVESLDDEIEYSLVIEVHNTQVDIQGLYLHSAQRVVSGISQDTRSLYLVRFFDKRWMLARTGWISRRYNVRDLESTDDSYRRGTAKDDAGTPWTWEDVFQDLWEACVPDLIGEYWFDGFQDEIDSEPENLFYQDMTPWTALCDCVRRVGCEVAYNPQDGTFRIIQMGKYDDQVDTVADTQIDQGGVWKDPGPQWNNFCASQTERSQGDGLLDDDENFIGIFVLPSQIRVVFPSNFPNSPSRGASYSVGVSGSGIDLKDWWGVVQPSSEWTTYEIVHDAMLAKFESEESGTLLNQTELQERAEEVAKLHYRRLMSGTPASLIWTGLKSHVPGRHIHEMTWGDFGDGLKTWLKRRIPEPVMKMPRNDKPPQLIKAVKVIGVRMKVEMTEDGAADILDTEDADNDGDTSEVLTPGVDCVQTIRMYRQQGGGPLSQDVADSLSGYWRVGVVVPDQGYSRYSFTGGSGLTSNLSANATAADVQSQLEAISGIGVGNVSCTGGPIHQSAIVVTFTGDLEKKPIALMKVEWGHIIGGWSPVGLMEEGCVPCKVEGFDDNQHPDTGFSTIEGNVLSPYWAVSVKALANRVGSSWYLSFQGGTWEGQAIEDLDAWDDLQGAGEGNVFPSGLIVPVDAEIPGRNHTSSDIVEGDGLYLTPVDGYWHTTKKRCD